MKKERTLKKLTLNRETVRSLEDGQMTQVEGGALTAFCTKTLCTNCKNCSQAC